MTTLTVGTLEWLRWLALFPLALFGLAMGGACLGHWSLQRAVSRLARTGCPGCGVPFGETAVRGAEAGWGREFQQMREANPGVRFRVVARWPLRCPNCGREFRFRVNDEQLLAG